MTAIQFAGWSIGVLASIGTLASAGADTILYDFEDGPQGWCSFGAVTTDSSCGSGVVPSSVGLGYFHTGDFDVPDESSFGMVDVSPAVGPLRDLSPYEGLSLDALFRDVPGFPSYGGTRELHVVIAKGFGAAEEEFFAAPVVLTDTFQTYAFAFADFQSTLTFAAPTFSDLADMTIKFVMYNADGTGTGELNYDQITGLDSIASTENADFDGNQRVDGRDFLIWQRNFGTGSILSQGDANNSGSVDGADLAIWQLQYGTDPGGLTINLSAVPEPSAFILLLLTVVSAIGSRRVGA